MQQATVMAVGLNLLRMTVIVTRFIQGRFFKVWPSVASPTPEKAAWGFEPLIRYSAHDVTPSRVGDHDAQK